MKSYQTLGILGFLYLGLFCTTAMAQKNKKMDLSAGMPTQFSPKDIEKLNYQYAIEIENQEYSGYSQLGLNIKYFDIEKRDQGHFKVGTSTYDKKLILKQKEGSNSNLIPLDRWTKENITEKGNLIFMIDGVVLNSKADVVLIDQNHIVDYTVTPLDQLGLDQSITVVQLRMKTKDNFRMMTKDKKQKHE